VYNGETFNYLELKDELVKKGHEFATDTDTEVLVHLFEEYGPKCLSRINGQFSMAIWDSKKKQLLLARDRLGIRPLYYTQTNGKLYFSSEIKALFVNETIKREIDPKALCQVFTFWTTLTPRTMFKGVHEEEAAEELEDLLKDAVRLRLRADVPVGAYLSGGLDSSIITTLISKYFNNNLRTFSMSFQERRFDESAFQKDLIRFLGAEHTQTLIGNQQIQAGLPEVIWHCEKPLLRTAPVPLFYLSDLVRENNFKVVLTGEGADEVFGGYNVFKEAKIREFWARGPESKLRPLLLERLYPYIFETPRRGRFFLQKIFSANPQDLGDPFFSHQIRWKNGSRNLSFFSEDVLRELVDYEPLKELRGRLPEDFAALDTLSKAQFLEMDIFLSNYLLSSQGDRVAMAHSLEIRLPFLDFRLMDFASRLPARWKLKGLKEKYILKEAFKDILPNGIRKRVKQPYRTPIREAFFNGHSAGYVGDVLSDRYLKKSQYFDRLKVRRLLNKYMSSHQGSSNEVQNMAFVGILSTQILHLQFVETFSSRYVEPVTPNKVEKG
jgi:asparagine synthase (glutamine-hydrolysing)